MNSKEYWDKKIIEWEDSLSTNKKISFIETLASKFRAPLKIRANLCLKLIKKFGKDKSILELGCGSGFFAFQIYKEVKPKKITGIDISHNAITRANNINKKLKLRDKITFFEGDVSLTKLPKTDITVGLGFLDYLNADEIKSLFKNLRSKYFVFTFSEKRFSILRFLHILYLISQRCPKHYYYTKEDILQFTQERFSDVKIISDSKLSFGCIVHNLPTKYFNY